MGEVRAEVGNLTGVMRAAIEDRDVRTVVPLAGTLSGFWTIEGDHLGVHAISQPVLDLIVEQPPAPDQDLAEVRGVLAGPGRDRRRSSPAHRRRTPSSCCARSGSAGDRSRTDVLARLILEVYADGTPSLEALDRLCDDPDPGLARGALQWATQVRENSGDLAGAIEASSRALLLSDASEGPWTRALLDSQVSGLATQAGDWDLAVEHASRALPVMRALGAAEDAVQLRSILAFADIAHGRLDEAARVIDEIVSDERTYTTIGWSVTGITGEAELALARGDVDRGLRLYLDCITMATRATRRLRRRLDPADALGPLRRGLGAVRARAPRSSRGSPLAGRARSAQAPGARWATRCRCWTTRCWAGCCWPSAAGS